MRRDKEVQRAFFKTYNEGELDFHPGLQDAFVKGAMWADVNPIYPEGVPMSGKKTPGEVLAVMNMLVEISSKAPSIKELRDLVSENVVNGRDPFCNIDHLRYFRRDTEKEGE